MTTKTQPATIKLGSVWRDPGTGEEARVKRRYAGNLSVEIRNGRRGRFRAAPTPFRLATFLNRFDNIRNPNQES